MAVITRPQDIKSLEIRKTLGLPNQCGNFWFGRSKLGDHFREAGIYQKRHRKRGQIFVRMKHYYPSNPRSIPQQANRALFATAIALWNAKTLEEQMVWNKMKKIKGKSGYNRFVSQYLKDNHL